MQFYKCFWGLVSFSVLPCWLLQQFTLSFNSLYDRSVLTCARTVVFLWIYHHRVFFRTVVFILGVGVDLPERGVFLRALRATFGVRSLPSLSDLLHIIIDAWKGENDFAEKSYKRNNQTQKCYRLHGFNWSPFGPTGSTHCYHVTNREKKSHVSELRLDESPFPPIKSSCDRGQCR